MIFILPGWYKHNSLFSNDHLHTSIDFSNRSWWDRIRGIEPKGQLRRDGTQRETFFLRCTLTDSMVCAEFGQRGMFQKTFPHQAASFMFEGCTHSVRFLFLSLWWCLLESWSAVHHSVLVLFVCESMCRLFEWGFVVIIIRWKSILLINGHSSFACATCDLVRYSIDIEFVAMTWFLLFSHWIQKHKILGRPKREKWEMKRGREEKDEPHTWRECRKSWEF